MNSTFHLARQAWESAHDLRSRRRRYLRYTYGRQWDDLTKSPRDGSNVTEAEAARQQGRTPHTNNLIRQLIKCVIGNFRSSLAEHDPAKTSAPDDSTDRRNHLTELDCRALEEFLISGCVIQRLTCERRPAGSGAWVDNVSPDDFFVNQFRDPRGFDIELIGMLHSMSYREVVMRFGAKSSESRRRIDRAYRLAVNGESYASLGISAPSRFTDAETGRCRVIEVWTLESRSVLRCHDPHDVRIFMTDTTQAPEINRINRRRTEAGLPTVVTEPFTSLRWHCRFYTPLGELIDEFDSPYAHGMHPFAVKFYPMVDGEVHSLVEDIIDQQRHINSLITLIDQIMRVSAKGVLLFPIDQKIKEMSWPDIGRAWAQPGSIIPYNPQRTGGEPHQVVSSADPSGAYRLLETHLDLFQKSSGVSEALQGRLPQTNTSAALYDSQLRSSSIALLDILETFNEFRLHRNELLINLV